MTFKLKINRVGKFSTYGVCRNSKFLVSTRRSYCVHQLSYSDRRTSIARKPRNLSFSFPSFSFFFLFPLSVHELLSSTNSISFFVLSCFFDFLFFFSFLLSFFSSYFSSHFSLGISPPIRSIIDHMGQRRKLPPHCLAHTICVVHTFPSIFLISEFFHFPLIHAMCHSTTYTSNNVKFRLSQSSTKFNVVTRFRKTIPTVKFVSSSKI